MRQPIKLTLSLLWLASLLTGCATVSQLPPSTSPPIKRSLAERQEALSQLTHWALNGKVAIQSTKNSVSGSINWSQNANRYLLSLTGPLGSGGFKLNGQPGHMVLQMADGKRYTANSPEQLLARYWGIHLPVSNLKYWVRGMPAPNSPSQSKTDNYNRLLYLDQAGWQIQYQSYTYAMGIDLPNKIYLNSAALKMKLIIYQWR